MDSKGNQNNLANTNSGNSQDASSKNSPHAVSNNKTIIFLILFCMILVSAVIVILSLDMRKNSNSAIEYQDNVAVAPEIKIDDIDIVECNNLMAMQDITEEYIKSATIGKQIQMCDIRDNKVYWVAKMSDGNLWMTQNLDLDLSEDITLSNTDTDLNSKDNWVPQYSTITLDSEEGWPSDSHLPQSKDAGNKYTVYVGGDELSSYYDSLSDCIQSGNSLEKCQHGHFGNYYNWYAATAWGSKMIISMEDGEDAPDSICPYGWQLPSHTVLNKSWNEVGLSFVETGVNEDTIKTALTQPFYLTLSGIASYEGSKSGRNGAYWTSTVTGTPAEGLIPKIYSLELRRYASRVEEYNTDYGYDVNPNYSTGDTIGYPIRCVSRW